MKSITYLKMQNRALKLHAVLHSTNYCGICLEELKGDEISSLIDSICVGDFKNVPLHHVISVLFGRESSRVTLNKYLCKSCKDSASAAFSFIQNAKRNVQLIENYLLELSNKSEELVSFYNKKSKAEKNIIIILNNIKDDCYDTDLVKVKGDKSKTCDNRNIKIESFEAENKMKTEKSNFNRIDDRNIDKSIFDTPVTVEYSDREDNSATEDPQFNNNPKHLFDRVGPLQSLSEVLKCQFCNVIFQSRSKYVKHMIKKHPQFGDPRKNLKPLTCKICHRQFLYPKSLITHWNTHNPCRKYKCVLCEVEFESKYMFTKHIRTVKHKLKKKIQNTQPKIKDCSICHKQFNDITLFNSHMAKHGPNAKHKCELCVIEFDTRLQFERHLKKLEHKVRVDPTRDISRLLVKPKNRHCSICQMEFNTYRAIKEHMLTHRPDEKHKCEPCCLEFNTRQEYIQHSNNVSHMKMLDTDKKLLHKCHLCEYTNYNKGYVKIHIDKHFGVTYPCHICGKQFKNPLCLKVHTDIHNGKKKKPGDNSKRICDLCGRVLCGPSAMKKHMMRHTGERPYKCDECKMCFVSASERGYHKRKVHMEKSVACPVCGKMFYLAPYMRRHVKKVHWKSNEEFDHRKLKGLTKEEYDLFRDRRKLNS